MGWLIFGILFTVFYFVVAQVVSRDGASFAVFRLAALLLPPFTGIAIIVRKRHQWSGCQWLFWATIALGLATFSVAHVGWTVDELLLGRQGSWLGWHSVFVMFGTAAPLLGLLAQPHRGARESAAPTTAVDIAGIAVVTGFLYSFLITAEDLAVGSPDAHLQPLMMLAELQPLIVFFGMASAALLWARTPWGPTYRRLAIGLGINFVTLSLTNLAIWQGIYRPGFVYDFMWILPFTFYPWAASCAPVSEGTPAESMAAEAETSQPWLIFSLLVLIPGLDYLLRWLVPSAAPEGSRDLATAVTVVSVLPLLLARLATERSERRRVDDKLRLLAGAVARADELIGIGTIDRTFVYANDAFCRALGYDRAELAVTDARLLFDEASSKKSDEIVEVCRRGEGWRGTLVRRRKDGSTFPVAVAVVPFSNEQGRITHLLSVEHDVTEEVRLREQLIHTERLSAVGQLVSGVAHELNNPLQSVIGYTELVLDGEHDDRTRADLEQIKREAMRAAGIVRNLLAFVRRSPAVCRDEDLNAVVRSAVALRTYELETDNIHVEERYAPQLPPVRMNREEIQQILLNLILNAEQAIKKDRGAGTLRVTTFLEGEQACIDVADDGPGVPAGIAGKIFEPFFTTKDVGEGTGLGLSIALGIAENHGGMLSLIPSKVGACFRLRLPVSSSAAQAVSESDRVLAT